MIVIACFAFFVSFCNRKAAPVDPGPPKTKVIIDLSAEKQTIHSFGASDCWTAKFYGQWPNLQKRNQIADLLFSMDTTADGSPKGIGLSLWRFNIGGGSYEQGVASNIATDWRREECFLNADGSYNWSKQAGQQWFLQAAKQRNVKYTLGFCLTPPVHMSKNGKAFNSSGGTSLNIQAGKLNDYAGFLAEVTKHFQFDYLSPVNEPQWAWGQANSAAQEGSQATNEEIANLTKLIAPKLMGSSSKVVVAEAGQLNYLYTNNTDGRGDQIAQFFAPSSSNYIGNLPNVLHTISGHSYFTTCPDNDMISIRQQIVNKINQVDPSLQLWQSEFGILGNICNQYSGSPRNTGIDYGMYVAKVIHHDLAIANMSSWQWWLAVSPYNYSDALVYVNAMNGSIDVDKTKDDGIVLDSKQLWSFGNFARFIRPGMKRIAVTVEGINDAATAAGSLMVSAYKDEAAKKLVLVFINPKSQMRNLQLAGASSGLAFAGGHVNAYITNASSGLKRSVMAVNDITIPAQSIVTLTATYQ